MFICMFCWLIGGLDGCLIGRFVFWLFCLVFGWLVDFTWTVKPHFCCTVYLFVCLLVGWLVDCMVVCLCFQFFCCWLFISSFSFFCWLLVFLVDFTWTVKPHFCCSVSLSISMLISSFTILLTFTASEINEETLNFEN